MSTPKDYFTSIDLINALIAIIKARSIKNKPDLLFVKKCSNT